MSPITMRGHSRDARALSEHRSAVPLMAAVTRDQSAVRVLVVERDLHMRALEAHFLRAAGYAVDFADDGQAGLAQARATLPHVVITEILVAKLDGLALCRQLKADEKTR